MDQINLPSNTSRSLPPNSDPSVQASPDYWMLRPYTSPLSPWQTQPLPLGSFYFAHRHHGQISGRAAPDSTPAQPTQTRPQRPLPHPGRSLRALQNPESVAASPATPTWALGSHPVSGVAHYVSEPNYDVNMTTGRRPMVDDPEQTNYGIRGLALQPHASGDWESAGADSNSLSTTTRLFPSSERLRNVSDPFAASSSSQMPSHSSNSISPIHSTHIPSPSSQRTPRSQASATTQEYRGTTGLSSPTSDRRRPASMRNRRPSGPRQSEPSLYRNHNDVYQLVSLTDYMATHRIQVFRGISSKMVASRAAIQSLEPLETCSLKEDDKTCVICYNDYGMASPEGVIEVAMRLPLCKHVFGDHCIKKWLENSDSCPYCRSKLESEPKRLHGSARTFLNIMRLRGLPISAGLSEEVIARLATRSTTDVELHELFLRAARTAERRPLPDDSVTQDQRRTRQRRDGPVHEEAHLASERVTHSRSTSTDAPFRQLPTISGEMASAESSRAAQLTVAETASTSTQQHQQPSLATGEESTQINSMGSEIGQATSAGTILRPSDASTSVAMNISSLRDLSTPNPLLSRLHHSSVSSMSTIPGTYRASILSTMDNPTQRPTDAELSPFRPSRIRPW
ncbi:hypothetical protein E4U21_001320 [Claviceps maximensis]|nr:hypothetical protein E4U21_001320 [Claviceps maximensis]